MSKKKEHEDTVEQEASTQADDDTHGEEEEKHEGQEDKEKGAKTKTKKKRAAQPPPGTMEGKKMYVSAAALAGLGLVLCLLFLSLCSLTSCLKAKKNLDTIQSLSDNQKLQLQRIMEMEATINAMTDLPGNVTEVETLLMLPALGETIGELITKTDDLIN